MSKTQLTGQSFHNFPSLDHLVVHVFVAVLCSSGHALVSVYFHSTLCCRTDRHNGFQGSRRSNESLFGGNGWKSIGTKLAEMEKRSGRIDLSREDRGQPCMHVRRNPLTRILSMEFRCYFVWNSSRADRITFFRGNRNWSTYWPFLIPAEWRRSKNGSCRWLESKWKRSGLGWGFEGRVRAITYGRITENLTDVVRREREIRIRVSLSPDFSSVSPVLIKTV